MSAYDEVQKFSVGDYARVRQHATPARWRGSKVRITADERLGSGSHNVYDAELIEDATQNTSFYGHELEPIAGSDVRASIASKLRALADEIEGLI